MNKLRKARRLRRLPIRMRVHVWGSGALREKERYWGVPNQWIKLSGMVKGDDFKFKDYYSIYGIKEVSPYPLDEGITEDFPP